MSTREEVRAVARELSLGANLVLDLRDNTAMTGTLVAREPDRLVLLTGRTAAGAGVERVSVELDDVADVLIRFETPPPE